MALAARADPYLGCAFLVELEGLVIAGFSEVSGLAAELEVLDYREGGVNDFAHRLPGPARYPTNLTLRRGITDSEELWDWWRDAVHGNVRRLTCSVLLLDSSREVVRRWEFKGAYPVRWTGPELRAETGTIAVEAFELAHRGFGPAQ